MWRRASFSDGSGGTDPDRLVCVSRATGAVLHTPGRF